jgi:hypothetical protein
MKNADEAAGSSLARCSTTPVLKERAGRAVSMRRSIAGSIRSGAVRALRAAAAQYAQVKGEAVCASMGTVVALTSNTQATSVSAVRFRAWVSLCANSLA